MTPRQPASQTPPALPELITPAEACALLDVSPRTLGRYQHDGLITPFRTPGGRRRFRRDEVRALLRRTEVA